MNLLRTLIRKLFLTVAMVTLVLKLVIGCPTYCDCTGYTSTCNSVPSTSLHTVSKEIPRATTVLEIRGGLFYSIKSTDFQQLQTTQLNELKITNGQLQEIQNDAFQIISTLRILILNNNQISTLQRGAFNGLTNLQTIDLSNNQLADIPSQVFTDQPNLRTLNIAGNKKINNLRGPSFAGLRNLRKFLASGCRIRTFETDFFSSVSTIDTLDLSYNEIQVLPPAMNYKDMRNIRNLTLQGNKITTLAESQFAELDLDVLNLSNNLIANVPKDVFMYLRVRNLDLSSNRLRTLPEYIFQPISSELFSLKLQFNRQLTSLPLKIFQGMTKLQMLNISNCALQSLGDDQFTQVFVLREIDLSNNQLKYISQSFLDRSNFIQTIGLNNNPWHCDCLIKPFHNWLKDPYSSGKLYCGPYSMPGYSTNCPKPKCAEPGNLMNRDISMLSDNDFENCENIGASSPLSVNIIAGIVAGAILVLVIVVVIVSCCVYQKRKRGQALPCYDPDEQPDKKWQEEQKAKEKKVKERRAKEKKAHEKKTKEKKVKGGYYEEKKERRNKDPEVGSLNDSDKSFVVRNFFHSMNPDPDAVSDGTQSMTRKGSQESLSQSGYGYGSRHGSRHSSQYSLNAGYKFESAV